MVEDAGFLVPIACPDMQLRQFGRRACVLDKEIRTHMRNLIRVSCEVRPTHDDAHG